MTTLRANRMPAITWRRLAANEAEIELPALPACAASAVSFGANPRIKFMEASVSGSTTIEGGTAPVTGALPEALDAAGVAEEWETGMGPAAHAWIQEHATRRIAVVIPAGQTEERPLVVRLNAQDGAETVAAVDVLAEAHSALDLDIHVDSPSGGAGTAALAVRIFAAEGARVNVRSVQTLGDGFVHLDDLGAYLAEGATVNAEQTILGAAESYTGFAADLAGREAACNVSTRYLGHGAQKIDFNYVMRNRGQNTACDLRANGVLMGSSEKTLRGTIDLVHGCKGAVGKEQETVLLANDAVHNKTVPVILCDEDDVQGAHGATIGHVNPEQLGYMATRGLTPEQMEDLFAVAAFDYAESRAFDSLCAEAVRRLGGEVLGSHYDAFREGD